MRHVDTSLPVDIGVRRHGQPSCPGSNCKAPHTFRAEPWGHVPCVAAAAVQVWGVWVVFGGGIFVAAVIAAVRIVRRKRKLRRQQGIQLDAGRGTSKFARLAVVAARTVDEAHHQRCGLRLHFWLTEALPLVDLPNHCNDCCCAASVCGADMACYNCSCASSKLSAAAEDSFGCAALGSGSGEACSATTVTLEQLQLQHMEMRQMLGKALQLLEEARGSSVNNNCNAS